MKNSSQKNNKKSNAAKMAALANSVNQLSQAAAKAGGLAQPSKVKKANKNAGRQREARMPVAEFTTMPRVGLFINPRQVISWNAGTTYVGNNALGVADSIYFRPAGLTTNVVLPTVAGVPAMIPIAASDTYVGSPYVADMEKHFARKRVIRQWIELQSLHPSTANDCVVYVAPVRGSGNLASATPSTGFAFAGSTALQISTVGGEFACPSYKNAQVDLTKYIAGGSGAKQNEFNLSNNFSASSSLGSTNDGNGVIPTAFVVGGSNSTLALRGLDIHVVRMVQEIELLDWIGGAYLSDPVALFSRRIEDAQKALEAHIAFVSRKPKAMEDASGKAQCRALSELRRKIASAGGVVPPEAQCPSNCLHCFTKLC